MKLPHLQDADVKGKRVLVRIDTDVEIVGNRVIDVTRLDSAFPTINYLLQHGATIILVGHRGRPDATKPIKDQPEFSLRLVAKWFARHFPDGEVYDITIGKFSGWKITDKITLLDNIRFFKGEEKLDTEFAQNLANTADLYVNDAFAVSHRNQVSTALICQFLPHYIGLHFAKEILELSGVIENPKRPLVVVIGGAKIETKLPLVEKMHKIADYVLVGGKIADETKVLLTVQHDEATRLRSILLVADLNKNKTDITHNSVQNFLQVIKNAQTIVWNGPVGYIPDQQSTINNQQEDTEKGSKELAVGIAKSGAYTIVGGGDSLAFLRRIHMLDKFSFVSTGGGAMLAFLSGEKLPGIEALQR